MRLALAPLNPTVGDIDGNTALIERAIDGARSSGAALLVTPEMSVVGYPARDLVLYDRFIDASMEAVRRIAVMSVGVTTIVGAPGRIGDRPASAGVTNSLFVLRDGEVIARYDKRLLPTYDVFDEARYFVPGERACCVEVEGVSVGLLVCEDLWRGGDAGVPQRYAEAPCPVAQTVEAGARLLVAPSASPFVVEKAAQQRAILERHVREQGVTLASINQLGGQDDLIFDGRSAVLAPDLGSPSGARCVGESRAFVGSMLTINAPVTPEEWRNARPVEPGEEPDESALLWSALTLGVRDYLRKTGIARVVIGLSGGIDSAVTACVAVGAIGADSVLGVAMPSRYSSEGSVTDAEALADGLGVRLVSAPIRDAHESVEATLAPLFATLDADAPPGVAEENVQARLRGLYLMAFANKLGALLLTTGNKSELAVGYCTLYGDMNGGLAVISDLTKARVYALARWINANPGATGLTEGVIPVSTIEKPPSAELRPDQTDQDTLPPYDVVDQVVERYIGQRRDVAEIVAATSIPEETVRRLIGMIDRNEHKRRQAALGLKISAVAFGPGRRMPLAQRWGHDR